MDYKTQDNLLINDIIERNYYWFFRQGNKKNICLTFYYNNKYNNSNLIPNFPSPKSNFNNILQNLNSFLTFYIQQNFLCDIKIKDDLWITDFDNRDIIIQTFIDNFKNTNIKPKNIYLSCNVIYCINNQYIWFKKIKEQFNQIGINLILNFETSLIDIVDVKYLFEIEEFLLNYCTKLKIKINPNNLIYFIEVFKKLYQKFKTILYLYEEDNVNWTHFKINEYIDFLNSYMDLLYNEYEDKKEFLQDIFNPHQKMDLISLSDNGVLNNNNPKGQCCFYKSLNILLEDFTINLCPKFQYDDQIIGQYYLNNDNLTIQAKYLGLISMNIHLKKSSTPHCETCPFVIFCQGFCCKESYNLCLNPIIPIQENCALKRAKYAFIFYKLNYLNYFKENNLDSIKYLTPYYRGEILTLAQNILGELI